MMAGTLVIEEQPVTDLVQLGADWEALEQRASSTIFLSWKWVGPWLATYKPPVSVLRVLAAGQLIGLGLVVEVNERRLGLLHSRCLRLHQTGQKTLDQIWIEYNGFLAETGREREVSAACLNYLMQKKPDWDELVIGAIDAADADFFTSVTGLHKHVRWEASCFGVDLANLRQNGAPFLDSLSRNTRYQINRTKRLYESRGHLELVRPESVTEALAMFESIGPWHVQRWGGEPDQSGFSNPEFVRFHRALIEANWAQGGVDLVSLKVGADVIVSFYNLIHNQVVYFYLGGMVTESDNKLKPGLLGHSLCIEDYRQQGFRYYDFMGGEERYKSNLGQLHGHLVQIALQRPRFKLKVESAMRQAKRHWIGVHKMVYGH